MNYKIVYLNDSDEDVEEVSEKYGHCEDGDRCICDECDDARRHPALPDYDNLPLFKAMGYKP